MAVFFVMVWKDETTQQTAVFPDVGMAVFFVMVWKDETTQQTAVFPDVGMAVLFVMVWKRLFGKGVHRLKVVCDRERLLEWFWIGWGVPVSQ